MSYRITVTPIIPQPDTTAITATQVVAATNPEPIFSTIVETVNLSRLCELLLTPAPPPRAPRADCGKPRGTRKPDGIELL